MDVIIWLILTILSIFFTLLMVFLEDYDRIYGFGLVISIVAMLGWIVAGVAAVDLTDTSAGYNASSAAMEEYVVHYENSWVITFFYLLLSVFPLLMILKKIPETWRMEKTD